MSLRIKYSYLIGVLFVQMLFSQVFSQNYDEVIYKIVAGEVVPESQLNLEKGTYELSFKVWVEPNAFIEGIKTTINPIGKSLSWKFEDVENSKWVMLAREFSIDDKVENGTFTIQLIEDAVFGVGEGNFYIDDISMKVKEAISDNFKIKTTGETCTGKNNGTIDILAESARDYKILLNDVNKGNFSNETVIENIAPGYYELCISSSENNFQQCFNLKIEEGKTISGKASINSKKASIEIDKGTPPFEVKLNGKTVLQTSFSNFEIDVDSGDLIEVSSNLNCEGIFSKKMELLDYIQVYPNPASGILNIETSISSVIYLYSSLGALMLTENCTYGIKSINIENLIAGIYLLKVVAKDKSITKKIIINKSM